jgi:formamidopyrimidine-DNA glycosylase
MPELPEVETVARSLAPQVVGRKITAISKFDWERMVETPDSTRFRDLIIGRHILGVGRRAKWVLLQLDAGWIMAIHLRMSGNLLVCATHDLPSVHVHLALQLDNGRQIFFDDQRKFGRVRLLDDEGMARLDEAHGPEPLDEQFTAAALFRILSKRQARIKPLLLDQHVIAGLGNIYVSEALWIARIHPLRTATRISEHETQALYQAIRDVLNQAIAHEGSSLRNYRNSYGRRGQNQEHFLVYDRSNQPCLRCGTAIERLVVAQRSTFICPVCQPIRANHGSEEEHANL